MCLGGASEFCAPLLFCRWCWAPLPLLEELAIVLSLQLLHDRCWALLCLFLRDHVFLSRLCWAVAHVFGDRDFSKLMWPQCYFSCQVTLLLAFVWLSITWMGVLPLWCQNGFCGSSHSKWLWYLSVCDFWSLGWDFGLSLSNHFFCVLIHCQHTHQGGEIWANQVDMNLDFIVMSVLTHVAWLSYSVEHLVKGEKFVFQMSILVWWLFGIACRYCDSSGCLPFVLPLISRGFG